MRRLTNTRTASTMLAPSSRTKRVMNQVALMKT